MHKTIIKIGTILVLLTLYPCFLMSQQELSIIAIISDVQGDVSVMKLSRTGPLKAIFGMQLTPGDQVKTDKKSSVTILFSDGNMISLGPSSNMTISGNEPGEGAKNIGAGLAGSFSDLTLRRDSKGEMGVLMDLRAGESEQFIIPTSPCNTMIRSNRPTLAWESAKTADTYVVKLFNSGGLVWQKETSDTQLSFPEDEPGLVFGESYFWNVEGTELIHSFKSLNQKFTILPKEEIEKINIREEKIRSMFAEDPNSSSCHSVLGAFYAQEGMYEDAIMEFVLVKEANPAASLPHEILAKLYRDVGKKDLAIIELEKALILEKEQ